MQRSKSASSLLICTTGGVGGMERVVCALARKLPGYGVATKTVFPEANSDPGLLAWCREQGVQAEKAPFVLPIHLPHDFRRMASLSQFIRRCNPDVVNLHFGDNFLSLKDILAVRLSGRRRCVASVHNVESWERLGEKKKNMTRLAAGLCDCVISNSSATMETLRQANIPTHKLTVIPCGVRLPEQKTDRLSSRGQFGLPPQAFVVGLAARLVTRKRVDALIEAAANIPDPAGALRVVIAGEGTERDNLERLAQARMPGRVVFLGNVDDMDAFYDTCDVFVLPSVQEGFGVVYLEAALHGLPSIGCDEAGTRDAVVNHETGLLVPRDEPEALTRAILSLWQDVALRQRLGEAALTRARAGFTEDVMAKRYASALKGRTVAV